MREQNIFIRSVSIVVSLSFILESLVFAAPDIRPVALPVMEKPSIRLDLPRSIATAGEAYRGSGAKTIFLIEDAHTNESGQLNIAKTLDRIVPEQGVRFVFLEGAFGNNSLVELRTAATPEKRKQVAKKYLRQGVLSGSEYFDITSNADFLPWGVENWDLYWKAVDSYQKVADGRERSQAYLASVGTTVEILKPRIYSSALMAFDTPARPLDGRSRAISPSPGEMTLSK